MDVALILKIWEKHPYNLTRGDIYLLQEAMKGTMPETDRMLKWFEYDHLPELLREISKKFHDMAHIMCKELLPGPERTVMLRKLLEAKDAAVRQRIEDQAIP